MGSCQGDCLILTAPARGALTEKKKRREGNNEKILKKEIHRLEELGNLVENPWTAHHWLNGGVPKASQGESEKTQASDMNRATMSYSTYFSRRVTSLVQPMFLNELGGERRRKDTLFSHRILHSPQKSESQKVKQPS